MVLSVQHALPDAGGSFVLDEKVLSCLPEGTKILHAVTWGASAWTKTAKITAQLSDGTPKNYFLKCATERGALMMEGEFNSLKAIRDISPLFAPKPYGWGKFETSDVYFLVMDFLDLKMSLVNPAKFCARLFELHQKSVSPTGMFGFHLPTCHGKNIQPNTWTPSWSKCFIELITAFFEEDVRVNGPWEEFDNAFAKLVDKTIPQLLEPLQVEGRALKPCLVHGDLWEENTGVDVQSGEPVVFDASVLYAHNEYEIGMWRREIVRFNQTYIRQYLLRSPPSEPTAQWDDRNRLYSIKFNFGHSISFPGSRHIREDMYNDMCFLNERYA
ncbi:Fructosamine kinase-domain-containing protein [Xylariaceae sp. FL1272]|nr:Fructosamine kinase-domain-containing protein [Xylariaceae sp. FL1272]